MSIKDTQVHMAIEKYLAFFKESNRAPADIDFVSEYGNFHHYINEQTILSVMWFRDSYRIRFKVRCRYRWKIEWKTDDGWSSAISHSKMYPHNNLYEACDWIRINSHQFERLVGTLVAIKL